MNGNKKVQVTYTINELRAISELAYFALNTNKNTDIIESLLEKTLEALKRNELLG